MFAIDRYRKAESLEDAVRLLSEDPDARPVAGGTDVLVRLRHGDPGYGNLVDIRGIPALQGVAGQRDGTVRIGALVTFSELMDSELVARRVPVLAEAAATVGGPQVRNMGTIGGNICNGAVSADTAAPLLVLEARLEIHGTGGRRVVPLAGFHLGPGRVALEPGDVLAAFLIGPAGYRGLGAAYHKYAMRGAMDIATIGCAAGVRLEGDVVAELRLAFTVAAPTPVRCPTAEAAAQGRALTDETLDAVAEGAAADVSPRTSWRAPKDLRLHLVRTLARRVVRQAAERAGRRSS